MKFPRHSCVTVLAQGRSWQAARKNMKIFTHLSGINHHVESEDFRENTGQKTRHMSSANHALMR